MADGDYGLAWALTIVNESRPAWHGQAACRGRHDEWWPDDYRTSAVKLAKVCARCPVRRQCADAGRTEAYGFWSGEPRSARRRRLQ